MAFQQRILGLKLEVGRIAEKINRMLEKSGRPYKDIRIIADLYQHIIDYGFTESNREVMYEFLNDGISQDVPFREKNWQSGKISPYAFLYMFFVSEVVRIIRQFDPSFDYNRLTKIVSYDLRTKLDDLRLGNQFGFSAHDYSKYFFKLSADIYAYIEGSPSLRASPSRKEEIYFELDKATYSITRAFDARPRRDNYAYFLTYRFLYTAGILIGDMTNIPILDSNDNLNFEIFARYFGIKRYSGERARYDDPERVFINDDKTRDDLEELRSHIIRIYNKLKVLNFDGLANLIEEMGERLVNNLKNLYNIKDRLEQYPDVTKTIILKKILYSPFCPPVFRKIAADKLFDFVEKILHKYSPNFLGRHKRKEDFYFSTLNSILYGISCLTPDYFKKLTGGTFKRDYEVTWGDINQFVRHVRTVVYRYHKDRGYINFNYLDISPRSKEYVYKQYNTIDLFMIAYHIHEDAFSNPETKISPNDLYKNSGLFKYFNKLTWYISSPYRLSNKAFGVMKGLLHTFINEARADLRDRRDPYVAIRQLSLYKEALKSVNELWALKMRLEAEFESEGWIRLRDDQSNTVEFLGDLFRDAKVKVRGWRNNFYKAFSQLMLFWDQGGMGADGNLIIDMFTSKAYTQVRQHMVSQGSKYRPSLSLMLLVLINSRTHNTFETLSPAHQKRIKNGLRELFKKGVEKGEITPEDYENEFGTGRKEEKFRISIRGRYSDLTLREIWEELDQQDFDFEKKLAEWSKIAKRFHDKLKKGENPYKAIIEGTPLEGAKYENALRFMRTLLAYENLRLREKKLSNTEDATIPQILSPSFNPNFHHDKLPKLYKKLFNDKFPDLLSEFGDDFYKQLMNRVINLDDLD